MFDTTKTLVRAGVVALTLSAPLGVVVVVTPGVANADVCASAGRRISVGGCVNIAQAVAPYAPPPSEYAPLPEDAPPPPPPAPPVSGCVGWNGRWVSANGCR